MDYTRMSWDEREALRRQYEWRIDAGRNRAVSGAELTNRTMDAALHGAPIEALELERATAEGMPEPEGDMRPFLQRLDEYERTLMEPATYEDRVHEFGPGRKVPEFTGELLSWSVQPCTGEGR